MVEAKRNPTALYCDDPSLTKQAFAEECDINTILERARTGSDISHVNARVAQYGDFTNVPSYEAALDLVSRASGMFLSLDALIRERFANDPGKMIMFLQDPKNRDEAIKLGLIVAMDAPVEAEGRNVANSVDKGSKAAKADKSPESGKGSAQ